MRSAKLLLVMLCVYSVPHSVLAIPTTWVYSGACEWGDCGTVSGVSGTLTGDPALVPPSSEINEYALFGDLISYSFTIGSYTFSGSSGLGTYYLDDAGNISGGNMSFGNLLALEFLGVGSATWSLLDVNVFSRSVEAGGSGSYATVPTAVAEPHSMALLGLGLIALGFARRYRNSRRGKVTRPFLSKVGQ